MNAAKKRERRRLILNARGAYKIILNTILHKFNYGWVIHTRHKTQDTRQRHNQTRCFYVEFFIKKKKTKNKIRKVSKTFFALLCAQLFVVVSFAAIVALICMFRTQTICWIFLWHHKKKTSMSSIYPYAIAAEVAFRKAILPDHSVSYKKHFIPTNRFIWK